MREERQGERLERGQKVGKLAGAGAAVLFPTHSNGSFSARCFQKKLSRGPPVLSPGKEGAGTVQSLARVSAKFRGCPLVDLHS